MKYVDIYGDSKSVGALLSGYGESKAAGKEVKEKEN